MLVCRSLSEENEVLALRGPDTIQATASTQRCLYVAPCTLHIAHDRELADVPSHKWGAATKIAFDAPGQQPPYGRWTVCKIHISLGLGTAFHVYHVCMPGQIPISHGLDTAYHAYHVRTPDLSLLQ